MFGVPRLGAGDAALVRERSGLGELLDVDLEHGGDTARLMAHRSGTCCADWWNDHRGTKSPPPSRPPGIGSCGRQVCLE